MALRCSQPEMRFFCGVSHHGLAGYARAGMNRIIYEVREDTVYIHIVCDTRQNLQGLLLKRIVNSA